MVCVLRVGSELGGDAAAQLARRIRGGVRAARPARAARRTGQSHRTPLVRSATRNACAGADEQRLGRVHGAIEVVGDLGDGEAVEVAQRERGAVVRAELGEHLVRARMRSKCSSRSSSTASSSASSEPQVALLARLRGASGRRACCARRSTSHAIVRSGTLSALDGLHRGEERLGGEVLGDGVARRRARAGSRTPGGAPGRTARAAPAPGRRRRGCCSHPIIARRPPTPTG